MGLTCSWVAIQTNLKSEVIGHLGLIETGEIVEPFARRNLISVYQNSNGWLYVFAHNFFWADQARTLDLSRFGLTLGVQADDKSAMDSIVRAAEYGRELWTVAHQNEPGLELTVVGDTPAILNDIRRKYEAQQKPDGHVDYLWEIPLDLARTLSGYSVWDDPFDFMELASPPTERRTIMSRIAAAFRRSSPSCP